VADEPTLGEVVRRLEAIHADLKEDLREYGARLDSKVSIERYELERRAADDVHRQVIERVTAIETSREREKQQREQDRRATDERRRADRRLAFTALIAPVLILLLQAYLSARGAGS
jgi:ferric-dicitrate binding protein FerR (iron transport regulator)